MGGSLLGNARPAQRELVKVVSLQRWPGIAVYVLEDPRDGAIHYAALSYEPTMQWKVSRHAAGEYANTRAWCTELRELGLEPRARVVEVVRCRFAKPQPDEFQRAGRVLSGLTAKLRRDKAPLVEYAPRDLYGRR